MKRIWPMVGLVLFEAIANFLSKKWSDTPQMLWLAILALFFYVVCNVFWLFALKNWSGLWRWAVIFAVSSCVLSLILSFFIFHEQLTIVQGIGIGLGMLSLILVSL